MKRIYSIVLCVLMVLALFGCGHKEPEIKGVIAIDPGHQGKLNLEQEPIGPGAKETKAKVTAGATGVSSGSTEAELVLAIGLKLQKALEEAGYEVVMTRTSQDVDLSNKDRAEIANEAEADAFIRLHLNSVNDQSVRGALTVAPSKKNPYLDEDTITESRSLSKIILKEFCKETKLRNRGVTYSDTMSGINWCEVPVCIIEMGFLSNPDEDKLLNKEDFQDQCVVGMVKGIDRYMASKEND